MKWINIIFLMVFAVFLVGSVSALLTDNLLSYYKLDESSGTVLDSLLRYNGTNVGAVAGVTGILNTAYDFESGDTGDRIKLGNFSEVFNQNISVSAWVKQESYGIDSQAIFSGSQEGFAIYTKPSSGGLAIGKMGINEHYSTELNVSLGSWSNVIIVYDDTNNQAYFYLNGTADSGNPHAYDSSTFSNTNISIGNRYDLGGIPYDGVIDEVGVWNRTLSTAEVTSLWNSGSGVTYPDFENTAPVVTLNTPSNASIFNGTSIDFNASMVYGGTFNLTNATINIWFSNGTIKNQTAHNLFGTSNSSLWTIYDWVTDNYLWNVYTCNGNVDTKNCSFAASNYTLSWTPIKVTNQVYNTSTIQTKQESFQIVINYSASEWTSVSGQLVYNGTYYTATKLGSGNDINFTKNMDIPLTASKNTTFYWVLTLIKATGSYVYTSSTQAHYVTEINGGLCNSTLTIPYLNTTVRDEGNLTLMDFLVDSSTFNYWVGSGSVFKTYTFSNITANPYYQFCFEPNTTSMKNNISFQYSASGYPQRTWSYDTALTNSTLNKTLYLAKTADGLYVTFQVVSGAAQPISDVEVTAERQISGIWTTIGSGYTDDSGGITFWLNPNYQHRFTFVASGYDDYTTTLTPAQSSYTITLGEISTTTLEDYGKGIDFSTSPTENNLNHSTSYSFWFYLESSEWALDKFGFCINNGSIDISCQSSTASSGGNTSVTLNTFGNNTFIMNYYWYVEGNYTNFSRLWYIYNQSDTDWSIKNFFDDLKRFTSDVDGGGIFGLNTFSRTLLIFLFIFICVGLLSYMSGMYSPASILTMTFAFVFFFDVILGMIPTPLSKAVSYFPTILVGIAMAGAWFMEFRG